jgi:dTDP-4-amino-4,6-dideoxygalactose transaminase
VYQKYTIEIEDKRDNLQDYLSKNNIVTKAYFGKPVHLTKFYKSAFGCKEGILPGTEKKAKQVLSLPMFPSLKKEEINYVVQKITEFLR